MLQNNVFMRRFKKGSFGRFAFFGTIATVVLGVPALRGQQLIRVPADQPGLQQAINAIADGGIIEMAGGTYMAPSGAFTVLDFGKGFTIRAAAGASVTLAGGGGDIFRFANSTGRVAHTITFERIQFANGVSPNDFLGGAITVVRNNVVFIGCIFQNNVANGSVSGGGAIWFESVVASFQQCTFTANNSRNYGGAIAMTGARTFFRDCTFSGNRCDLPNHAQNAVGGAIFNSDSSIRADNCRFENNHAGLGGGAIYCGGHWQDPLSTPTAELIANNCLFTGNSAMRDPSVNFSEAPLGGAVFIEDQTNGKFFNCRFIDNFAIQGGAISSYRTSTEIANCIFQGNHADGSKIGESLGGSIIALSADNPDSSTNNGTINRRSIDLTVRDTIFRGDGTSKNALQGGAIFASGDLSANYGLNGIKQNGDETINRAMVKLTRVGFSGLVTKNIGSIPGSAGAVGGSFVAFTMDNSIMENCSTTDLGGAMQFSQNSAGTITNSTIANCQAGSLGGAIAFLGGRLDMQACNLVGNKSTSAGQGGAIGSAPAPAGNDGVPAFDLNGVVANCIFSNNTGGPTLWEGDRIDFPFNRLQYAGNQIFTTGDPAFFSQISGNQTVQQLNNLKINRSDGTVTVKAPTANSAPSSAPVVGSILMIPPTILQTGAAGEAVPIPSYLIYAASGGTASVDGAAQSINSGLVFTSTDGNHILTVGNSVFNTPPSPKAFAANISTRLPVGTNQNVLIGGFIIQGPSPKRIIIRAIGPSLNGILAGALQDPYLELHDGTGALIANNDNWGTTQLGSGLIASDQSIDIQGSGVAPTNSNESAILATLNPGPYTAVVRGTNNSTGIALVEAYDLDPIQTSTLANIATRGFVQTADNVMIGGFIYLGGVGATTVVVRGIGPSLQAAGIANPLSDPTLELHDSNGATLASNDDWRSSPDAAAIQAAGLQPSNDAESAIYKTGLPRGAYTAILRGKNGGVGVGVVEVYVF